MEFINTLEKGNSEFTFEKLENFLDPSSKIGYANYCHDGRLYEKLTINESWIYSITNLRKSAHFLRHWMSFQIPFNKPYKTELRT